MFIPNSPNPPNGIAHNEGVLEGVFKGCVCLALASSYHTPRFARPSAARKAPVRDEMCAGFAPAGCCIGHGMGIASKRRSGSGVDYAEIALQHPAP